MGLNSSKGKDIDLGDLEFSWTIACFRDGIPTLLAMEAYEAQLSSGQNESNPRIIHQLHSHFTTAGLLLLHQKQDSEKLILFNPLLRCYSLGETPLRAYFLYDQLQQLHFLSDHDKRLPPFDSYTYLFLIKATSNPLVGIGLHGLTLKLGFEFHVYVQTALVGMYFAAGNRVSAYKVFDEMPERSLVTWNVMITGLTNSGEFEKALCLLEKMPNRNVVSWTTLIDGYARVNKPKEAILLFWRMACDAIKPNEITILVILPAVWSFGDLRIMFKDMERLGLRPNRVTMISVLNACSHGGLAEEEFLEFFNKMVSKYKITPDVKHYGCLVDMLRRKGRLEEAERIALEIPSDQKAVVWRMLLGACSVYDDPEMAERITKKLMELERSHGGDYVLMSNIFCGTGRFSDGERFRKLMDVRGVAKLPGHSQLT
ncbi:hypothetical protein Bca52824_075956 [Brassica carinata]|uniref:Pentatricopeptide repeat-containing protein n=1 Tax=Brassica carinata TaxID=52824 RepID=A0A8X7PTV1_BRACI|nr:hypothetical protein Bca52824_075956 [Brassica carinata]